LLPRFALPLVPIWALAAVAAVCRLWWLVQPGVKNGARARSRLLLGGGLIALLLMVGAPGAGIRSVLDHQDRAEAEAVALIRRTLGRSDQLEARLPSGGFIHKYSAIAHLFAARGEPARFVLWSEAAGQPVPDSVPIGRAGRFALYRLED
jgi:hypothetical protein